MKACIMNRKFYNTKLTNTEKVVRAINNFENLNNEIMMGSPSVIAEELKNTINLAKFLNDEAILAEKFINNTLLEKQINEIERLKEKRYYDRGLVQSLFGSKLNFADEDNKIKTLKDQLQDVRLFSIKGDLSDFKNNNIEQIKKISRYIELLKKSLKLAEERDFLRKGSIETKRLEKERKEAEQIADEERIKALAAAHIGKSRQRAAIIKNGLLVQITLISCCPYCGNSLGSSPHADHIYPVSRGGLSTADNMIYVCQKCNSKKSDKTLLEFIYSNKDLDLNFIYKNLNILKKRV